VSEEIDLEREREREEKKRNLYNSVCVVVNENISQKNECCGF
jgi:hypothetical protein